VDDKGYMAWRTENAYKTNKGAMSLDRAVRPEEEGRIFTTEDRVWSEE